MSWDEGYYKLEIGKNGKGGYLTVTADNPTDAKNKFRYLLHTDFTIDYNTPLYLYSSSIVCTGLGRHGKETCRHWHYIDTFYL